MANPYLNAENPYLQSSIDKAQGDLVRNYNTTAQPAYNNAMVKSGSFGNEGVQQMNENSQKNLQDSLGNISTTLRGNDYNQQQSMYQWDQGFNRAVNNDKTASDQFTQNYNRAVNNDNTANSQWNDNFNRSVYNDAYSQNNQNLQTGIGLLGAMNGYNQQDLNNGTTVQNAPLNYYGQFANMANGIGQGFATNTDVQGRSGSPLTSALGGYQLGTQLGNAYNNRNGTGNTDWVNGSGNYSQYNNQDYGQFF